VISKTYGKSFNKDQKGSTLIEVLVTLFIMAVGLLGLASMQIISIKNINNSQFRTLATDYAYDMAERMRANTSGVDSGNYDSLSTSGAVETSCSLSSCSTSEIADLDEYEWSELITQDVVSGGLPSGSGTVTANGDVYDIHIQWNEQDRDSSGGLVNTAEFTLSVQL
jgi:type IV pilus assembly protein PilV